MNIIVIGIDLAKSIFAVHGVNENGKAELVKPKVSRDQLLPLIANLSPCLIGWRAPLGTPIPSPCYTFISRHHWVSLEKLGYPHRARAMTL